MKKLIASLVLVPVFLVGMPTTRLMSEKCESDTELVQSFKPEKFDLEKELTHSETENYEKVIDFIKAHEGYAGGKEYTCVSGRRTIGYGHVIKKGEVFAEKISKEFADSLLRADFNAAYNLTCKYTPQLKGSRKLAVAHFIYSKGISAFLTSSLRKAIKRNAKVDNEFSKWCYYTDYQTGKKIYSKVGARIQKWENNMWHTDDDLYAKAQQQEKRKF